MLTKEELDALMVKINLTEFKEEVKRKNNAGRKPIDLFNRWFERFQDVHDYEDLAPWVDDVFRGAGMMNNGEQHNRVSPMMIYHLIKSIPFFTTGEIKSHINRKRRVLGGKTMNSDSYPRWLISVLRCVMNGLDYHTEYKNESLLKFKDVKEVFIFSEDKRGWEEHKAACNAQGLEVTANLNNPLSDIPLNDRKLLAGLTVDEIEGVRNLSITSGEIDIDTLSFRNPVNDYPIKRYTKKQFEKDRKHSDSFHSVSIENLPDMVDLDTGELISYITTSEID